MSGDGSFARPWRTIQYGVDHVADGGTVNVASGDYAEDVTLSRSNITLVGAGSSSTRISGSGLGSAVTVTPGTQYVIIRAFEIRDGSAPQGGGIYLLPHELCDDPGLPHQ